MCCVHLILWLRDCRDESVRGAEELCRGLQNGVFVLEMMHVHEGVFSSKDWNVFLAGCRGNRC